MAEEGFLSREQNPVAVHPPAEARLLARLVDGPDVESSIGAEFCRLGGQVEDAENGGALEAPDEGQRFASGFTSGGGCVFQERNITLDQGGGLPPEAQQAPVMGKDRRIVGVLAIDGPTQVGGRHRQPWTAAGESRRRRTAFPDHRGAAAVASLEFGPQAQ